MEEFVNINEHPFDQDGFFYIPCEKDQILKSVYRESHQLPGPILSAEHSSKYLLLDKATRSRVTCLEKKYRSITANVGVSAHSGSNAYYFEAWSTKSCGNFRIGFVEYSATLQAPVGYDQYGFGFRDIDGSKVNRSVRMPYAGKGFEGAVVGCLIQFSKRLPFQVPAKERIPIKYKGNLFFEIKDTKSLKPESSVASNNPKCQLDWLKLSDSNNNEQTRIESYERIKKQSLELNDSFASITLFINGESQGEAFRVPIDNGETYFPCVSLYDHISVQFNPGPKFACPPNIDGPFEPWSSASIETEVEGTMRDILDDLQNE